MSIESKVYLDLARIWNVGPGEVEKLVRDYIGAVTCDFKQLQPYPKPHIQIEPVKIKTLKERLEEKKMKATSVQNIKNVKDICISAATFPMGGREESLTIEIYTDDDIFEFNFEGWDLVQKCKKAGLFSGREKEQKIRKLDLERAANEEPHSRRDILRCAEKCVCGQREQDYGTPESNFQLIADLWNDYLGITDYVLELQERIMDLKDKGVDVNVNVPDPSPILSVDVAMMMALLKIARIRNGGGSGDSFVDLAGYAACGGEIWAGQKDQKDQN